MASQLTDITEIVTGLGMAGVESLATALQSQPPQLRFVDATTWDRLVEGHSDPKHASAFEMAWNNGRAFLDSPDGLRGRLPLSIEWRGGQKSKGDTSVPADLRVDHVFLISCKYLSKNIQSPSPHNLFNSLLIEALKKHRTPDWYVATAPEEYQALYDCVRNAEPALRELSSDHQSLTSEQRDLLVKAALANDSSEMNACYKALAERVSIESARIWKSNLPTAADREKMLWRLLRLQAAPYFLLGQSSAGNTRFRIATPWDWSVRYKFRSLEIDSDSNAGQPTVRWTATVRDRESNIDVVTKGHIEVRWTHKKFRMPPEGKVYIDTPVGELPGYFPI
jgi:hypothetical protein